MVPEIFWFLWSSAPSPDLKRTTFISDFPCYRHWAVFFHKLPIAQPRTLNKGNLPMGAKNFTQCYTIRLNGFNQYCPIYIRKCAILRPIATHNPKNLIIVRFNINFGQNKIGNFSTPQSSLPPAKLSPLWNRNIPFYHQWSNIWQPRAQITDLWTMITWKRIAALQKSYTP